MPAVFFRLANGREPVREWLLSEEISRLDRRRLGEAIRIVQRGWPVGMPVCRSLGSGLWEIRVTLDGCIARVLFCIHAGCVVLLHAFVKKSQATPARELETARRRQREVETD